MSLDDFIITYFCLIDEMLPRATQGFSKVVGEKEESIR
jgi:hypothetical protein